MVYMIWSQNDDSSITYETIESEIDSDTDTLCKNDAFPSPTV